MFPHLAVGHKPEPVSLVVRTRARGFDRDRPHGVIQGFQITSHKSEPCRRSRNLFSKDIWRTSLGDKASELGPEVAAVVEASLHAGDGERLTGARSCPDGPLVGPSCDAQSERPAADTGEEVALSVAGEIVGLHIDDAALVHVPWCDVPGGDEVSEPSGGVRVALVVISGAIHDTIHDGIVASCEGA